MSQQSSPQTIVELATAYMGAQQLISASRVGLFGALRHGSRTSAELAAATGRPEHQVRILADSMTAHGLLTRHEGRYGLTGEARAYLTEGEGSLDLGPFLNFLGTVSYDQWRGYQHTVDTDEAGTLDLPENGWDEFLAGVMKYNELHAEQLVRSFDFTGFTSILDLGTLSPAFAQEILEVNTDATIDVMVDPESAADFSKALDAAGLAARSTVTGVATPEAEPAGSYDLVMLNHVLHRFTPEQNEAFLRTARAVVAEDATLVMLDFYLDDGPHPRLLDAVHAGEYYNIDGTMVYPLREVMGWLQATGWAFESLVEVPGSPRLLVAKAV